MRRFPASPGRFPPGPVPGDRSPALELVAVAPAPERTLVMRAHRRAMGGKKEETMGMWAAVTGAVMGGFCLGTPLTSLLHIAKRVDAEAESFVDTAHPARMGK